MSDHLHPPQKGSRRHGHAHQMHPAPDCSPRFPDAGRLTGQVLHPNGGSITAL